MLYVNPLQNMSATSSGIVEPKAQKQSKALGEFEHFFAYTLVKEMRKTAPKDQLLGASSAQQHFEEMLDDAYAGQMAQSGQFGIAKMIAAQMKTEEASRNLNTSAVPGGLPLHKAASFPNNYLRPVEAKPVTRPYQQGIALPSKGAGLPLNQAAVK